MVQQPVLKVVQARSQILDNPMWQSTSWKSAVSSSRFNPAHLPWPRHIRKLFHKQMDPRCSHEKYYHWYQPH